MEIFKAKLNSVSFVRKCQNRSGIPVETWNFIVWIFPCSVLMMVCVPHVYHIPFITAMPSSKIGSHLNVTFYDTFEEDLPQCENSDKPFGCELIWLKIIYFVAFFASQVSMGFLADRFGHWKLMKFCVKSLIVCGIIIVTTGKH